MCSSGIRIDGIDIDGVCHVSPRPVRQLQRTRLSLSTSTVTAVDEGGGDNVEVGSISMKTTDDYGAGQITVLEGLDPVRKRPGMCVSFHRMQYVLYGCVYIHIITLHVVLLHGYLLLPVVACCYLLLPLVTFCCLV